MAETPRRITTTASMVALYEATRPLLDALQAVAIVQAARRGHTAVPASTLAEAGSVFGAVSRVLSREPMVRGLFGMPAELTWAGLLSKLELALAAFADFRGRYGYFDNQFGEFVWRTEGRRA